MDYKDYYATLGVAREASQEEIQRTYRQLARAYHPDVNKDPGAEERFKELGEAYEVLKDPEKRAKYDRYGAAWRAAQAHGGAPPPGYEDLWGDLGATAGTPFPDFGSLFEQLFGSARRRGAAGGTREAGSHDGPWTRVRQGKDQEAHLALSLEEAAHGGQREMSLSDPITGRIKVLTVNIPPGIRPGQRIRLAGQGGQGTDGAAAGDLYLLVEIRPHPTFRLEGIDLYTTLPTSPWEAALGAEVTLPTLEGAVHVKVPPGSSSGRLIRLKGKGFPEARHGPGHLYAEIRIVVPDQLSARERKLFEKLSRASSFRPRARPASG
ncbi:Curved DNA-binding protein [Candidatus Entotheonellaceae bacterium PAL068K]